jgi:predicted porin
MNNRLTALIVASAFATILPAQTAFQVGGSTELVLSGLLAVGVKSSQITNVTLPGRTPQRELRVDDDTSRLTVSGSTLITEGYKVIFRVESRFTTDTRPGATAYPGALNVFNIAGWADGDTWGGVSTPIGSLVAGKSAFYYLDTFDASYLGIPGPGEGYRAWDGQGLAFFNLLSQVSTTTSLKATLGITRSQNVIRFDSVAFHGLDWNLVYSKNPSGDELKNGAAGVTAASYESGGTWGSRLRYNNGGLTALVSILDQQPQGNAYGATHGLRAGVGYLFKQGPVAGLKFGVEYDKTSIDCPSATGYAASPVVGLPALGTQAASRTVYSVPVQYQWGKHGVYVTYTKAGNTTSMADTGATQTNLGYDYALTKRAFLGLYYTDLKNDAKGIYAPFLSGSALGGSAPNYGNATGPAGAPVTTGEGYRQFALCLNYWF